jgi:hypothetical protein
MSSSRNGRGYPAIRTADSIEDHELNPEFRARLRSLFSQIIKSERLYRKLKVEMAQLKHIKPETLWQEILLSASQGITQPNLNGVIRPNPAHQLSAIYRMDQSSISENHQSQETLLLSDLFRYFSMNYRQLSPEECNALRYRLSAEELSYRDYLKLIQH